MKKLVSGLLAFSLIAISMQIALAQTTTGTDAMTSTDTSMSSDMGSNILDTSMATDTSMSSDASTTAAPELRDVVKGSWYAQAVANMATLGVVKGYDDGTFRPLAAVTRAEIVVIIERVRALIFARTMNVDFMLCYGLPDAPVGTQTQAVVDKYITLKTRYCAAASGAASANAEVSF